MHEKVRFGRWALSRSKILSKVWSFSNATFSPLAGRQGTLEELHSGAHLARRLEKSCALTDRSVFISLPEVKIILGLPLLGVCYPHSSVLAVCVVVNNTLELCSTDGVGQTPLGHHITFGMGYWGVGFYVLRVPFGRKELGIGPGRTCFAHNSSSPIICNRAKRRLNFRCGSVMPSKCTVATRLFAPPSTLSTLP